MNLSKVCVITGATSGIGKETAKAVAAAGINLVLPVRNMEKGSQLKEELLLINSNISIETYYCNLESLNSVRAFANFFKDNYKRLDILINNAGVWFSKRELTQDGFEKNFAINHLSHFLLTKELLDILTQTTDARIINVASEAHKFSTMNFEDLQSEKSFNSFKAYGQSKLANILFTRYLAKKLSSSGVTVNCLHPGVVSTNLFDKMSGFMKKIFQLFMISPQKGAATTIHLALSETVNGQSGLYFKKKKATTPNKSAQNDADAERLWQESENIIRSLAVNV